MNYLRIAGVVVAALAIAFIWWRVQLSFSQGNVIDEQRGHIDSLEMAAARDQRISNTMADFRGQQQTFEGWFREQLSKKPLTVEVTHVDPKSGATVTCRERDAVRYRSLYNAAVTGSTDGVP